MRLIAFKLWDFYHCTCVWRHQRCFSGLGGWSFCKGRACYIPCWLL